MKGIELPINVIVIVSIAVLVLLVIGGFFTSSTGSGITQFNDLTARGQACSELVSKSCVGSTESIRVQNNGIETSLSQLCINTGIVSSDGAVDEEACKSICGC